MRPWYLSDFFAVKGVQQGCGRYGKARPEQEDGEKVAEQGEADTCVTMKGKRKEAEGG